jgi:hypothetical protein
MEVQANPITGQAGAARLPQTCVRDPYETPTLRVVGTVTSLTQWCIWDKTYGDPDYTLCIPITNCSS